MDGSTLLASVTRGVLGAGSPLAPICTCVCRAVNGLSLCRRDCSWVEGSRRSARVHHSAPSCTTSLTANTGMSPSNPYASQSMPRALPATPWRGEHLAQLKNPEPKHGGIYQLLFQHLQLSISIE